MGDYQPKRVATDMRRVRRSINGKVYRCCYCSDAFPTTGTLSYHEIHCPMRRVREEEWREERARYVARYNHTKYYKEIE